MKTFIEKFVLVTMKFKTRLFSTIIFFTLKYDIFFINISKYSTLEPQIVAFTFFMESQISFYANFCNNEFDYLIKKKIFIFMSEN